MQHPYTDGDRDIDCKNDELILNWKNGELLSRSIPAISDTPARWKAIETGKDLAILTYREGDGNACTVAENKNRILQNRENLANHEQDFQDFQDLHD